LIIRNLSHEIVVTDITFCKTHQLLIFVRDVGLYCLLITEESIMAKTWK